MAHKNTAGPITVYEKPSPDERVMAFVFFQLKKRRLAERQEARDAESPRFFREKGEENIQAKAPQPPKRRFLHLRKLRVDKIITIENLFLKPENAAGVVLAVVVHKHSDPAAQKMKGRRPGVGLTGIFGEANARDAAFMLPAELFDDLKGPVRRAVVDKENAKVVPALPMGFRKDPLHRVPKILLRTVARDGDGQRVHSVTSASKVMIGQRPGDAADTDRRQDRMLL